MRYEIEYQYQMKAEAAYQRKMTAETANQYQKTEAPQERSATEQRQSTENHNLTASFLYGCGVSKTDTNNQCQQLLILATLATAMRAANVADFYMTKYLSKAQEALGLAIQPFVACMRRISTAESAPEVAERTLTQKARLRIRRFIFSANRTMWFSACELGVFLSTGDSCVRTETTTKVFSGRGLAMMHEYKRLLNHSTAADGFLVARCSSQVPKTTPMHAFLLPEPADNDDDEDVEAAESHGSQQDDNDDAKDHATEQVDQSEDDCDEALPPCITSDDAAAFVANATGKKQMFTKSLAHRDDWLHRGIMLRDMDYFHYSRYVDRVELPRSGSAQRFQKYHGVFLAANSLNHFIQTPADHINNLCAALPNSDDTVGFFQLLPFLGGAAGYQAYDLGVLVITLQYRSNTLQLEAHIDVEVF